MPRVQTEDKQFFRDTDSKGLLQTDRASLMAARQNRRHVQTQKAQQADLQAQINQLHADLDDLRNEVVALKKQFTRF